MEKKGRKFTGKDVAWEDVTPTFSHMFLVKLHEMGKLKFIISQNVDCLHLRSGIPRDKIAELHGNVFKEKCPKCNMEYFQYFDVKGIAFQPTGRSCTAPGCEGKLVDELLDWEDALPNDALEVAEEHCRRADLAICLGTSLRVEPASELPLLTQKHGGQLCIINLQATKKDSVADIRVFDYCDHFLREVAKQLDLCVAEYNREKDFISARQVLVLPSPFETILLRFEQETNSKRKSAKKERVKTELMEKVKTEEAEGVERVIVLRSK
eukprot:TRINITY_DN492_c0_g2_i1.p1 TRINITY_DN492_c0_g2~~TRINITY_DN492_c0_g2_i1.p1  ORF type:complete len:267 (-),score=45.50 TRINITY_DN492_c0_g2_i1:538-1338(-)